MNTSQNKSKQGYLCDINLSAKEFISPQQSSHRAYPLNDPAMPQIPQAATSNTRRKGLISIISYLKANQSLRYKPKDRKTYCNVYAYDYAYLANTYLPRVWWTDSALHLAEQDDVKPIIWGVTVREMTANEIYGWLDKFGSNCGWVQVTREVKAYNTMQDAANAGNVVVIIARKRNGHGHISMVVPENGPHTAYRDKTNNLVKSPLQSMAGSHPVEYCCQYPNWEKKGGFDDYAYWINKGKGCRKKNWIKRICHFFKWAIL